MFYSLKKGVQYRCTENYGYIAKLDSGYQLTLDAVGADFIKELSETPKSLDEIVDNLVIKYDALREEISKDFLDIATVLQDEGFISVSSTQDFQEHEERKLPVINREIPPITDLTIEITNRCNERCVHCYLADAKKDNGKKLDISLVKRLIDEFAQMGGERITFTGGEPFLHPDLLSAIEYAAQRKLKVAIFSNLISVSTTQIKILKSLGNIIEIQVSLYSTDSAVHDMITKVKGSCCRTLTSIERMKDAGLPIKIACPVMLENKACVFNVIDYAKSQNIAVELEMYINSREDQSDDNLRHRMSIEEMSAFMYELMDYDEKLAIEILHRHKNKYDQTYNLVEELNMPLCQAGYYGLYVTADGVIAICPNMQGYALGDINVNNLQDIWIHNQKLENIRNIRECDFKECIRCEARDYCIRCFAHNYAEAKDILTMPKYACEMAFATKQIVENRNNEA
jgi:radical SAM protein with 4Fe4S-binding SPASM domain